MLQLNLTPVDFQNISPVVSARALAKLQNLMHKLRVQFSDQLFKRRIRETRFVAHVIVQCLMRSSSCDVQNIFPIIEQLANLIDIY